MYNCVNYIIDLFKLYYCVKVSISEKYNKTVNANIEAINGDQNADNTTDPTKSNFHQGSLYNTTNLLGYPL